MIKIKSLILALSLSPLLLSAWQLPNQAQLSPNSPSKGTAGSVSGNNSGASGASIFSIPVTVQNGGTTTSGNITVTPGEAGTPPIITVPSTIQSAVNTSGQSAVVTLQTGGLTQQQLLALVVAVTPTVVSSTQGQVPGGVSLQTSTGSSQTFTSLASAFAALSTSLGLIPANGSVSLQIGNKTITISN